MNSTNKRVLYNDESVEFSSKGWSGILKPLNDFYQHNELYYFLFPHQIKEKFGALRIYISPYRFYKDLLTDKAANNIEKIDLTLDTFKDFGEEEREYYPLSEIFNFPGVGQEMLERIKPEEISLFLKHSLRGDVNINDYTPDIDFLKMVISNALKEFIAPEEHIKDFGYLSNKLNSFTELAEEMSCNVCMVCSNLGNIGQHSAQSMYMSCKCLKCSSVELSSGKRIDPKNIDSSSINEFSVYDLEVSKAFSFYKKHPELSMKILNTPIDGMSELLIENDFLERSEEIKKSWYTTMTYTTELLNFIEFKQKYLYSSQKLNPFIVLSLFSLTMDLPVMLGAGVKEPTPSNFLEAWENLKIGNKIDTDIMINFLKEFKNMPKAQSMYMKEISRHEVDNLIVYIEAKNQKDNLSKSIEEIKSLPSIKNKL